MCVRSCFPPFFQPLRLGSPPGLPRHSPELQQLLLAGPAAEIEDPAGARLQDAAAEAASCHQLAPLPDLFSCLASISVSRSMRISPGCTGPRTFLRMILLASLPPSTLQRTWMASPLTPVLPMTSSTRAGTASVNLIWPLTSGCFSCSA